MRAEEASPFLYSGVLRMLTEVDEKHLQTLYRFACQCLKQNDAKTAESLFCALFYFDAWNFDYALALGLCRQMRGAHEEALLCFARAGTVNATDPRPAYYAALSYQKLGNVKYAQLALSAALRCASNQPQYQDLQQKAECALAQLPSENSD